jgi:hypothetical protein
VKLKTEILHTLIEGSVTLSTDVPIFQFSGILSGISVCNKSADGETIIMPIKLTLAEILSFVGGRETVGDTLAVGSFSSEERRVLTENPDMTIAQ